MKKLLLGLFLGILLTKASYTTYSYSWWKADGSPECISVKTDDGPDEGLDPIFQCIHSWKAYEGFTKSYDYCEHCDEKKND